MKWIHYSKFTGDDFGLSAEDLLKALSDFFLQSGFQNQYMGFSEWNQHTLEDLKNAHPAGARAGRDVRSRAGPAHPASARKHVARADGRADESPGAEAGGRRLHQHRSAAGQRNRARRHRQCRSQGGCQDHGQIHRFSRIQDAQGSARLARQIELRRARHARSGHRRRNQRRGQTLRIRRHPEPGHQPDACSRRSSAKA